MHMASNRDDAGLFLSCHLVVRPCHGADDVCVLSSTDHALACAASAFWQQQLCVKKNRSAVQDRHDALRCHAEIFPSHV